MKRARKIAVKLKYLLLLIILFVFIRCEGDKAVYPEYEGEQDEQDPGGHVEKVIDIDENYIF